MTYWELKLQIDNLVTLIELEEEKYNTALQTHDFVNPQREMEYIEQLQADLQVFLDKENGDV